MIVIFGDPNPTLSCVSENKDCSICFEEMSPTDSRYLNPCLHRFHNECINVS